jgi:class 3 adenylate cyclase
MYLLIMVLGTLRGDLSPRLSRWYTIGVLAVTAICASIVVLDTMGIADTMDGLTFNDFSVMLVLGVMVAALVFGVVFSLFAVEVVRLGMRLLRAKGYERWVGAGAVASLLLTITLKVLSEFAGVGLSGWLSVLADYCSYVAVPISVAVYLAIRSAHHNRLVARQRDELDAEVKERTAELRAERDRSNELLLNILPEEVAEELKAKGAADARHFDQATVLFTDFRGFTQLSEQVGPAELVQELNACFKAFDAIMGKYRIEKIKTIGDAYMAAGGLPDPSHGGPLDVVLAALEMQAFMVEHKAERVAAGKPCFEMRVGIHTGPVVAGIVGVKKFQYDIWGDTVNTASRMESSGEIGHVNISGATYERVKDQPGLVFTPRGKVQAKGKGEMEMWFVERA